MLDPKPTRDLTRTTLGVLFVVLLAAASLWIMRPFVLALVWAATIVVATWPVMLKVEARLFGKRSLATAAMVVVLLLVFLVPVVLAVAVLIANRHLLTDFEATLREARLPAPPGWVERLPLVGAHVAESWQRLASAGPEGLLAQVGPRAGEFAEWLIARLGRLGLVVAEFLLTAALAGVLYAKGEVAAAGLRQFATRLAGPNGDAAVVLAGRSIRGIALGVVVTAFAQAIVGGLGLVIAGVPAPVLLTAVMFLLSIAQIGAAPVLLVATLWMFAQGEVGWGIGLAAWTLIVGSMDNVIRPLLIQRGAKLPLLLVFAGVIGGLLAFGVIGIFVGPVFLAVTHTLLGAWVRGEDAVPVGGTTPA